MKPITVAEAKTKGCPFIQYHSELLSLKCICSDCMAWEHIDMYYCPVCNSSMSMRKECDCVIPEDEKVGVCLRLRGE